MCSVETENSHVWDAGDPNDIGGKWCSNFKWTFILYTVNYVSLNKADIQAFQDVSQSTTGWFLYMGLFDITLKNETFLNQFLCSKIILVYKYMVYTK